MKKYFLVILILVSSFAFSQKKDNTRINPEDFEKVQVELQKQSEIQKQFYSEIELLNKKITTLSSENIILKEKLSIIKSDLEKLTSESSNSDNELSQKIDNTFTELSKEFHNLKDSISTTKEEVQNSITELQSELYIKIDDQYTIIDNKQKADKDTICNELSKTNKSIVNTQDELSNQSSTGIIITAVLITVIVMIVFLLSKKIKKGNNNIDDVKKVQASLQKTQIRIQEESLKLDNKLLEIVEKQMAVTPIKKEENEIDHSLALKVADEIVRIETNLSRMDANIKGHKQLSKAVERIKNNFYANGYEIVDMLGKEYNDGMKVIANFVYDEELEKGKQVITGITKPQINFNGKMIQAAQITVSQNI